jgi:hypothetical protein
MVSNSRALDVLPPPSYTSWQVFFADTVQNKCMDRSGLHGGSEKIRRFVKFRGVLLRVFMWCSQWQFLPVSTWVCHVDIITPIFHINSYFSSSDVE